MGDFFFPERLGDFFFVARGWVIFFCPETLGVFFFRRGWAIYFCPERLGVFFVLGGLVIFFSSVCEVNVTHVISYCVLIGRLRVYLACLFVTR